jgi:4-hydroxy-3-polyprenylbenzoate decarboxylase
MRLIIAITGASGSIYGIRLLEFLNTRKDIETHLIMSATAGTVIPYETAYARIEQVQRLATFCYRDEDLAAPVASGTFITAGMIVAPCSAKTLSAVAHAYGATLIARAADVCLKERRKLALVFRETPLTLAHIDNMQRVTAMGGIVVPPLPGFYTRPKTVDDIINHSVGKILDLFGIEHDLFRRWGEKP